MLNITRALRNKKKKNDRRCASVVEPVIVHVQQSPMVVQSASLASRRSLESPNHHSASSRCESNPAPVYPIPLVTSEAWIKSAGPTPGVSSPTIPKVNVLTDEGTTLDRQDVISITKDVQKFLATISELRLAMEEADITRPEVNILGEDHGTEDILSNGMQEEEDEEEGEMEGVSFKKERDDKVVEKLKELIQTVQICLESNPGMQSSELTQRCKQLLVTYEHCEHDTETGRISECATCNKAVDDLVDSFTQSVSDYMMGDSAQTVESTATAASLHQHKSSRSQGLVTNRTLGFSKSYDNLHKFGSYMDLTQPFNEPMVDRIDQALSSIGDAVRVASQYLKSRQKYHHQVVSYLLKRAQIEQRYYTQLGKIVKNTQNAIAELHQHQEFLPLVDVFRSSLDEDSRYAMNCNTTFNLQVGHKIIEQLERKIQECEKMRKELMANWQKELKKITESRMVMKKAKATYRLCGQDLSRTKNLLAAEPYGKQADKRKKEITELEAKWVESEQAYKDAVAHCNDCQYQVHATAQKSILCAYRRIVMDFDATLKQGLETYFQLQYNFFKSLPDPLEESLERTREYEVGNEFLLFIERHPTVEEEIEDYHFEEFDPEFEGLEDGEGEARVDSPPASLPTSIQDLKAVAERPTSPVLPSALEIKNAFLRNESPSPRFGKRTRPVSVAILDNSSMATSANESSFYRRNSEKSKDSSSYLLASPQVGSGNSGAYPEDPVLSKVARTHQFKKLRTPSRCRGCDTYVYFHGSECEICYLACHRKCLASLAIRCGNKRLPRKMNTFGVNFHEHLAATKKMIPIIVTKCINEIDERGLDTQGLYRISSAKSKMERLCQLFESGAERVDLSDLPPHLISSCLKLYFRQLPEPLLTFGFYQEFLTFAREASLVLPCDLTSVDEQHQKNARQMLDRLKDLLGRLPEQNQLTLARLMYHLHRVGRSEHVKVNCMPPSNLGIVFGPNLMRQREIVPSLALLANMSFQAKAVEIMIAHVHDVFHIPEEEIKQLELETSEDNENGRYQERLVDGVIKNLDNEDGVKHTLAVETNFVDPRTPFSTPPERRKQNVQELNDMWQDFGTDCLTVLGSPIKGRPSNVQPPLLASPLLTDSRYSERLRNDEDDNNSLPGLVYDNRSFSESVLSTLEQRLYPPSNNIPVPSPPAFESYLTPVQENSEDYRTVSDDEEDTRIVQSACNTLDRPKRRSHSFTKSNSTGFAVDNESEIGIENDSVFHSRTSSNVSGASRRLLLSSRSEENLLKHPCESNSSPRGRGTCAQAENNFELEIRKLVEESHEDGRQSSDSGDSQPSDYKPFQSANVQALLLSEATPSRGYLNSNSSNEETPPIRSLPRNFRHPSSHSSSQQGKASASFPVRQNSEGQIRFAIGSPLDSPVSLGSMDRTMSTLGSQGSEGFFSDSMPIPETTLNWASKSDHNGGSSVDLSKNQPAQATCGSYPEDSNKKDSKDNLTRDQPQRSSVANDTVYYPNSVNSVEEDADDIPLPDDSFSTSNPAHVLKKRFSASRDSGLSDSPDPSVDLCMSPGHSFSSRVLTEQLVPPALQGDKNLHSPLHQSTAASDIVKNRQGSSLVDQHVLPPDTAQVCNSSQSTVGTVSEEHKHSVAQKPAQHVTRILKITPSLSMKLPAMSSSDNKASPPVQRLRMVSPDQLASPEDELDSPMKRSKSLAEALTQGIQKNLDENEERVGELIVSHAIPSRRLSRARRINLNAADKRKHFSHSRSADDHADSYFAGTSTTSPRSRRTPQFV